MRRKKQKVIWILVIMLVGFHWGILGYIEKNMNCVNEPECSRQCQGWKQKAARKILWHKGRKEIQVFPVKEIPTEAIPFENSYGGERNYGGKRSHEGIDIIPLKAAAGEYAVVSVTDGIVEKMGWLKLGGYRIGIRSRSGLYFYYAHLDHYEEGLHEKQAVKAGDVIGYMGDTGYGSEGTRGKFVVHLHFGVYFMENGEEISINPYYVLTEKWNAQVHR